MADGYVGGLVMSVGGDFLYQSCLFLVGNGDVDGVFGNYGGGRFGRCFLETFF